MSFDTRKDSLSYQLASGYLDDQDQYEDQLPLTVPQPIAVFEIVDEQFYPKKHVVTIPVYANKVFYIGRGQNSRGTEIRDVSVSNRHLEVRCAVFDPSQRYVPPLIHVVDQSLNGTFLRPREGLKMILTEKNQPLLLSDGDCLRLGAFTICTLHLDSSVMRMPMILTESQRLEYEAFSHRYTISDRPIGTGGNAAVFMASSASSPVPLACKVIALKTRNFSFDSQVRASSSRISRSKTFRDRFREFDVLRGLSHPNIIALRKVFWTEETIYIFTDLCKGGDACSYLNLRKSIIPEREAATMLFQILQGVKYLHEQNIVHRDLKLENILMTSFDPANRLVISDFGLARRIPKEETQGGNVYPARMKTWILSRGLRQNAPEMEQAREVGYTKAVDIWSIGIIAAHLISGQEPPGKEANILDYFLNIPTNPHWDEVGRKAKNFVFHLLIKDESRRPTAEAALRHRWFTKASHQAALVEDYDIAVKNWTEQPADNSDVVEKLDLGGLIGEPSSETPSSSSPSRRVCEAHAESRRKQGQKRKRLFELKNKCSQDIAPLQEAQICNSGDIVMQSVERAGHMETIKDATIRSLANENEAFVTPTHVVHVEGDIAMFDDCQTPDHISIERVEAFIIGEYRKHKPHGPKNDIDIYAEPTSSFSDSILDSPPRPPEMSFNPNQVGFREQQYNARPSGGKSKSRVPKSSNPSDFTEEFQVPDRNSFVKLKDKNAPFHGDGFDDHFIPRKIRKPLRVLGATKVNARAGKVAPGVALRSVFEDVEDEAEHDCIDD